MLSVKDLLDPKGREDVQEIIEKSEKNCIKFIRIIEAYESLIKKAKTQKEKEIICIGTYFLTQNNKL